MHIGTLSLKNNVFLAPMAGITNLPFRLLIREFGCALAFTEMVSANGLVRKGGKTDRYLDSTSDDKPLGVQLFGADPLVLAEAARIVTAAGAELLDINMGCPVKKVVKTGAGAALMRTPAKVALILKAVREATPLPLTVKVRSGWNQREVTVFDIASIAEDCGVDAIIYHPRTAEQGFSGSADWDMIGMLKKKARVPVIGSGDVWSPEDAFRMLAVTGCDGVMVGRGALGNPWIFRDILTYMTSRTLPSPPSLSEREKIILYHMNLELQYAKGNKGLKSFRKHLLWYTKGLRGGNVFRKVVGSIDNEEVMVRLLHEFFHSFDQGSPK